MGTLHWVWVLVSLALQQRKDKKLKRGDKLSWEGQRKILCVPGKETMGHGEGIKRTTSFSASQPCSLSYSLTLEQPVVPCFSHCSPGTAVVKLHPIQCVSPRDREGSSALSIRSVLRSHLPPPLWWHFDVFPTHSCLSQAPRIKLQPHNLCWM